MTLTIIIILISIGLIFILLEILVVPGTVVLGLIGLGLMIAGVWSAYAKLGTATGNYTLISTGLVSVLLLYYSLRSRTWKKLMLNATVKGKVNTFAGAPVKTGDKGITISRLAPIGKAMFNNNLYEVQSLMQFVDENEKITIVKVEGKKIYVKADNV